MEIFLKTDNSLNGKNLKRNDEIDIIKALGIICMVLGHSGAPFTKFIYLFHMAVFFIASGFFFKDSSSDSIKSVISLIIKKLKLLWLPYFVWNMVYTLLNNFFIKINFYTDNPDLMNYVSGKYIRTHAYMSVPEIIKNVINGALFGGGTEMGGAFWFLRVLFMVSVSYCIGDFCAKKVFKKSLIFQLIASMILLAAGYWCFLNGHGVYSIAQTASFYCLYFIGYFFKLMQSKYQGWNWKQFLPVFFVSFAMLLILNQLGEIELAQNYYENPAFLLAASFMGWCFLYSISYFIALLPIKSFFLGIGKRTLTIVIFHFLSFKLVEIIVVKVYSLPNFCVAAFPNLYGTMGMWWLAYTVIGVGVPVFLNISFRFLVSKISLLKVRNKTC